MCWWSYKLAQAAHSESQISLFLFGFGLLYFLLLRIMTKGGRVEDFNYSEKVKEVVEVWEIQHGAGCYVEIAHIWNAIKLVWLLASEKKYIPFLFSSQMKMYRVFCWKIPGGNSRLLNICNTACTVQLKWVLRWVIHCGFPFDISKGMQLLNHGFTVIYFFSYYWCVVEL